MQNIGVFLAVAAIIDFDRGHKQCQLCIVQFSPQKVYDVFILHSATVAIQNVDCFLKLAIKDIEFNGPFIPLGKGHQYFLGLVDIHVLHLWVMLPILEYFDINSAIVFLDPRFDWRVCMKGFRNVASDDVVHHQCTQLVFVASVWRR